MRLREIPVIAHVIDAGADDRVFDALLLLGPVLIALIALVGRTTLTEAIAVAYLGTLIGYVLYRGTEPSSR